MQQIVPLILALTLSFVQAAIAQTHSLVKKWETDSVFKTPESVLFDAKRQVLYVANMDAASGDKGGKGSLSKLGLDGKIIALDWVTGLQSPKGMGIYRNRLYVTELTGIAVIDIEKGKVVERIPVEGAVFLNDISIDKNGALYVSDFKTLKVHRLEKGLVATVLQNLQAPNGVLAIGDELLVLDKGNLIKMLAHGKAVNIAGGMDPSTDGIEMVKPNEYIVSAWSGVLYYLSADGSKQTLLDTRNQKINSADIGYDPKNRIVYIPTFFRNSIVAYVVN